MAPRFWQALVVPWRAWSSVDEVVDSVVRVASRIPPKPSGF